MALLNSYMGIEPTTRPESSRGCSHVLPAVDFQDICNANSPLSEVYTDFATME